MDTLKRITENMGIIRIGEGKNIHIDLTKRKVEFEKKRMEHEITKMTIDQLLEKLKELNKATGLNYIFGASSFDGGVNISFARGEKPKLDYMKKVIDKEIDGLWE